MTEHPFIASRRAFLATTASAAALATFTKPQAAKAAALSDVEEANAKVVQDFCDAWATRDAEKIGSYLAEDASFRMIESSERKEGREPIMEGIEKFLGTMKIAEFEVLRSSVLGNTVINDRIDRFENAEKRWNSTSRGSSMSRTARLRSGKTTPGRRSISTCETVEPVKK